MAGLARPPCLRHRSAGGETRCRTLRTRRTNQPSTPAARPVAELEVLSLRPLELEAVLDVEENGLLDELEEELEDLDEVEELDWDEDDEGDDDDDDDEDEDW